MECKKCEYFNKGDFKCDENADIENIDDKYHCNYDEIKKRKTEYIFKDIGRRAIDLSEIRSIFINTDNRIELTIYYKNPTNDNDYYEWEHSQAKEALKVIKEIKKQLSDRLFFFNEGIK